MEDLELKFREKEKEKQLEVEALHEGAGGDLGLGSFHALLLPKAYNCRVNLLNSYQTIQLCFFSECVLLIFQFGV